MRAELLELGEVPSSTSHLGSCTDCQRWWRQAANLGRSLRQLPRVEARTAPRQTLTSFAAARAAHEARVDAELQSSEARMREVMGLLPRHRAPESLTRRVFAAIRPQPDRRWGPVPLAAAAAAVLMVWASLQTPRNPNGDGVVLGARLDVEVVPTDVSRIHPFRHHAVMAPSLAGVGGRNGR